MSAHAESAEMDGMKPLSQFATPLLTDLYQITMAYGYWKAGRHNDEAVFDLYFRRNPFCGYREALPCVRLLMHLQGVHRVCRARGVPPLREVVQVLGEGAGISEEHQSALRRRTPYGMHWNTGLSPCAFVCRRSSTTCGVWSRVPCASTPSRRARSCSHACR